MNNTRKSSLKDKIKQYLCFSCCFTTAHNDHETLNSSPTTYDNNNVSNNNRPLYLIGASSQWIKTRASVNIPEMKHMCRNMFNKIGAKHNNHRRRRSSADFKYDPLSYALNFEEESCGNFDDDSPLKDFTSRLPSSPPPSSAAPKTAL